MYKQLSPKITREEEFPILRDLAFGHDWPVAVRPELICNFNSEVEKADRARSILDLLLDESVENKRVLDFGCGEGHLAKEISLQGASLSIGYDIQVQGKAFIWGKKIDNFLLTNDFEKVSTESPYDIIILYDVLDHFAGQSYFDLFKLLKSVSCQSTRIYLRVHPWTGRHGGHLYPYLNKAFAHLIFTQEELRLMSCPNLIHTSQNKNQLSIYKNLFPSEFKPCIPARPFLPHAKWWFVQLAGNCKRNIFPMHHLLKRIIKNDVMLSVAEFVDSQPVEAFFENNQVVHDRIIRNFNLNNKFRKLPLKLMEINFVDFIVRPF